MKQPKYNIYQTGRFLMSINEYGIFSGGIKSSIISVITTAAYNVINHAQLNLFIELILTTGDLFSTNEIIDSGGITMCIQNDSKVKILGLSGTKGKNDISITTAIIVSVTALERRI